MADIEKIKIGSTEYNVKDVTSGYITGIDSSDVTTALGYTPYDSSNPNGYTSNVGTVTSVNSVTPDASGDVTLSIPTVNNATLTVTQNGTSKGTFTANSSTDTTIALTDTTYSVFTGANGSAAGTTGLVPQPSATDNTKFLKGDGTWETVDALPSQTSQSGKYLTTNGTTASWADAPEEIAFVEYNVTSFADVVTAFESGKTVICKKINSGVTDYFELCRSVTYSGGYLTFEFQKSYTVVYVLIEDQATAWHTKSVEELPSQSGNSGKLLTTDGSSASWTSLKTINSSSLIGTGNISITGLPSQTSQSGKFLTTDGSSASWASISIPTVDQTYDSTSSNAQSGVAINGAKFIRNTASGTNSLTISGNGSGNSNSINIGKSSSAWSDDATTVGYNAGSAQYSVAIGSSSRANSNNCIALGYNAQTEGNRTQAIQIGEGTNITSNSLSIGFGSTYGNYTLLDGTTGLIPDARISNNIVKTVNSISPDANGNVGLTIPVVDQTYSSSSANAQSGVAISGAKFIRNDATVSPALSIGNSSSYQYSICIGDGAQVKNTYATAIGEQAIAGQYSTALGYGAQVNGASAVQLGYGGGTAKKFSVGFYNDSSTHYNWIMLDGTTGLIPDARISSNIARTSQIPAGLPSQTGHSGDILTTDGTDASWADTAQVYPIIETYSNGDDWYKIYAPDSTGYRWCVQASLYYKGSTLATTDNTITFLKPFANINYTFIAVPIHNTANISQSQIYEKYVSRATTSTVLRVVGATFGYSWIAYGYIADEAS